MSEPTHFEKFADHIISNDDSELGRVKAERDYALHCLEREIAICANTQAKNDALVRALEDILTANELFRAGKGWLGDPLGCACDAAKWLLAVVGDATKP